MRRGFTLLAIVALVAVVLSGCVTIQVPLPAEEPPTVVVETPEVVEEPTAEPTEEPIEEPVEEPEEPIEDPAEESEETEESEEPANSCVPCEGARINHESEQCYAIGETLPSGCIVAARGWFDCPKRDGSRYLLAATRQWCDPEPEPKPEATSRWACDPKCPCYGARVHGSPPGACPQCFQIGETAPLGCVVVARGWFKCTDDDGNFFLLEGNRQWVDPDPAAKPELDDSEEPEIRVFTVEPTTIFAGEPVVLTYEVANADEAALDFIGYAYAGITVPLYSASGQKTIRPTARDGSPGPGCITLTAKNAVGTIEETICVDVRCQYEWVPELRGNPPSGECPGVPYSGWMAYQRFEHGVMIWSEGTDTIYVFFDELPGNEVGYVRIFKDDFNEGDVESDPSLAPPDGFLQPIRGFGLVWRNNQDVRDRLGWAVEKERGYNGWVQSYVNGKYFSGGLVKSIDGTIYNITWLYQYWTIYVP